jgi:C-terminal processing protease CtpA/Prc
LIGEKVDWLKMLRKKGTRIELSLEEVQEEIEKSIKIKKEKSVSSKVHNEKFETKEQRIGFIEQEYMKK